MKTFISVTHEQLGKTNLLGSGRLVKFTYDGKDYCARLIGKVAGSDVWGMENGEEAIAIPWSRVSLMTNLELEKLDI